MPQVCKICTHPKRSEIDKALATGAGSERAIAARFGVPAQSVHRHKANHLPSLLASLGARVQAFEADEILGQVVGLYERSLELLNTAEQRLATDRRPSALSAASRAIKEARASVELMAKLSIAMREEAAQAEALSVENTSRPDLDSAIEEALSRRGMTAQGPRANASRFGQALALPSGIDDEAIADAEIVDE